MRIHILSDIHNEFGQFTLPDVDSDLLILAGDTDLGSQGVKWILQEYREKPVLYVIGNHEYYGQKVPSLQKRLITGAEAYNLHVLENQEWVMDDIRFLGCTLWTDFNLFGPAKKDFAMFEAQQKMTDFQRIRLGQAYRYRKLCPSDTVIFHWQSRKFLNNKLAEPFPGKTVIITHHAASAKSLDEAGQNDLLSAAYCSDMENLILQYQPQLWIHGHLHRSLDYKIGNTRVICNPRGYFACQEVGDFQPDFVLDV